MSQPRRPATLTAALDLAAADAAAGLRFLARDESERFLAWPEIRRRAHAVAAGLVAVGVAPGERVGLVFPTGPDFFDAFFGTLVAGAVPVPLYPPVRLGRLGEYHRRTAGMLAAAGARLVLADARVRRLLGETVARARPPLGCRTVAGVVAEAGGAAPPPVAAEPGELALVQFSSGTTVEPKPVALTHRALLAQADALNALWPELLADKPTGVSWLPLYHDMGLIGCVLPALLLPSVLTLLPPEAFVARPALWLRAISRYRSAVSPAPNFAYSLAVHRVRDEELEGVDLSCWRVALNGAEAVAPSVLAAFRDRFAAWGLPRESLTPVYGLSEAALAVTFSALDRPFTTTRFDREALSADGEAVPVADELDAAAGDPATGTPRSVEVPAVELVSVGRPLPGFEVAVLPEGPDPDAEGALPPSPAEAAPLPEGAAGRVWVRGPSLMEGYLGRPEETARALRGGWLDTGDLGFQWRGELYLTGRAKDVLILRGRNHAPQDLERAAWDVPGARRGCAVAVSWLPEGAEGERLVLFVESAASAGPEERRRLVAECGRAVLAATGLVADEVVVLAPGTLPRTSSGKLRRRETLARHLAGTLLPPEPVTALRLAGALGRSGLAFARHAVLTRRRVAGRREAGQREAGQREAGQREAGQREAANRATGQRASGERETGSRDAAPGVGARGPGPEEG